MNLKKFYRDLKFGVLKPKIFIILFCLFFSSLAFAAALTVTWVDGRIPSGNGNCTSSQTGATLGNDRTEDPHDVHFSDDGLQVFTANHNMQSQLDLSMNRLSVPFDLTSVKTDNGSTVCNDLDGFDPGLLSGTGASGGIDQALEDINIVDNGRIFFFLDTAGRMGKFNLTTPFDFSTATFENRFITPDNTNDHASFSRDGKKMFLLSSQNNTPNLRSYSLSASFDISSPTQTSIVNLTTIGVELTDGETDRARDIEFSDTGSAMFILTSADNDGDSRDNSYIYQFSLGKNYDVSTATFVGKWNVASFGNTSSGTGMPRGFSFSSDGMKIYIVQIQSGDGVDQINQFNLECPFGLVACVSDSTGSIGSQVELSKQNISLNVSTIFKRFEWIKRNRDQENLTSHNININYPNPLLKALTKQFQPTLRKNLVALASKSEKKEKKSKWSSWSLGDLSINNYDEHGFQKAKSIKTTGLTFGSDRKFGDNKFLGLALRYGDNKSNIFNTKQNTDMESLTLNIYGIIPVNEDKYINAVVGLGALRFDNKYLDKLSGERNGKQAFTSINYRTKNTYGKFNITPTGKLTYGVTRLSKFTDFISNTIDSPARNIIYAEDTFESGEFSAGFLFEMDKMEDEDGGTFQPMGGIEILYDLSPDINYKYTYEGSTPVNKDTILGKYSRRSLKTEIGFEKVYLNGFTISPIYERIIMLSNDKEKKLYSERFIVKLSRSKEENNSEFALNFNSIENNQTNINYKKAMNGYDIVFSSNYKLNSKIPDYGANIEVSSTF